MKILIATDGSEYSKRALDKCTAFFAHGTNTEIKVVSVYENAYATMATEPFMPQPGYSEELIEASRKLAEGFTTSAKALLTERFNGNAPKITSEVLDGIPAQQIVQKAAGWNADLIVVASHGRGFWGRMLGSVSDAVVHQAPCSVLVVRDWR